MKNIFDRMNDRCVNIGKWIFNHAPLVCAGLLIIATILFFYGFISLLKGLGQLSKM